MRNKPKVLLTFFASLALVACSGDPGTNKVENSPDPGSPGIDVSTSKLVRLFNEPSSTPVYTTNFVIADYKDITEVHHDEDDGAWQFLSDDRFDDFTKVAKVVGLGQIVKLDSTLFEIANMPVGYVAHRKFKGDKWIVEKKKRNLHK